jgi:hypothetical protein
VVAIVVLQRSVEVTGDPVLGGRLAMDRAGHGLVVVVTAAAPCLNPGWMFVECRPNARQVVRCGARKEPLKENAG